MEAMETAVPDGDALLEIRGLKTHFFTREGVVRAVDGVNLTVPRGKTVCIVGESGCGKSMTARSILGLVEPPGKVVEGQILWRPQPVRELVHTDGSAEDTEADADALERPDRRGPSRPAGAARRTPSRPGRIPTRIDLAAIDPRGEQMRRIRGGEIAMIFQEPMASLSARCTPSAPVRRGDPAAPADGQAARPASAPSSCCGRSASPAPSSASTRTPSSCPAECVSGR